MKDTRKLLLCLDCSDESMSSVRYVAGAFSPEKTKVVLFHVNPEIPESFLDLRSEPGFRSSVISTGAWSAQVKKDINNFMEKARTALLKADFAPDNVKIKVKSKKMGIARDIMNESRKGYDAAFVGRTGVSRLKDVIMGSVSNKLIGKMSNIPLVVVGDNPSSKKLLIGFDGSESSIKAVECAGKLMGAPDREVTLCHVIRPMGLYLGVKMLFKPEQEAEWIKMNTKKIKPAFAEVEDHLVNRGFDSNFIFKEILSSKASRASAITRKAEADLCGTIFLGRRGLTIVEEFLIGRVSAKVLNMAYEPAVWIV